MPVSFPIPFYAKKECYNKGALKPELILLYVYIRYINDDNRIASASTLKARNFEMFEVQSLDRFYNSDH